ncbi:MAG: inositol monophosphatase [Oscillospiraceae bacterium]|nr:inositol monophosphatase [Oscillospiraceae bacterium]
MHLPVLSDILPIVRSAGQIILKREGADAIQAKAAQDFVTAVDFCVQQYICDCLRENWPQIQFMGEEKDNTDIDFSKPYWVLDPIDGTTNFIHDFRASVISLALVCDHDPIFGVVYNPSTGEEFTGIRGGGAYLNGAPIRVSEARSLSEALVFVGTAPYRRNEMDENFRRIQRVYLSSHDIRRFGCTALELCYIACGRADGQFEFGTKPWDIAAGWLILREAGGEVVSVYGGSPPLDGESAIVSTNGNFTEELRSLI